MNQDLRELMDAEKSEKNIIFISINSDSLLEYSNISGPQVFYTDSRSLSSFCAYRSRVYAKYTGP